MCHTKLKNCRGARTDVFVHVAITMVTPYLQKICPQVILNFIYTLSQYIHVSHKVIYDLGMVRD